MLKSETKTKFCKGGQMKDTLSIKFCYSLCFGRKNPCKGFRKTLLDDWG